MGFHNPIYHQDRMSSKMLFEIYDQNVHCMRYIAQNLESMKGYIPTKDKIPPMPAFYIEWFNPFSVKYKNQILLVKILVVSEHIQ